MKKSEWGCFSQSNSLLYQWMYSALRVPSPIPHSLAEDVCIEYSSNHSCANFSLSSLNLTMWSLANVASLLCCLLSASTILSSGERASCLRVSPSQYHQPGVIFFGELTQKLTKDFQNRKTCSANILQQGEACVVRFV